VPPVRAGLTTAKSSLKRNRKLRLARPWASVSEGGLRLARPQGSAPASASEGGLRLARPRARPQPRPRRMVSASSDPRARPRPRPKKESRPHPASASGGVTASPDLGLGPTTHRGVHHYPTPSYIRLRGTRPASHLARPGKPSNDGTPRAPMTTAVLSPLRKQGDVSKVPAAPTAVLL
jgi:hypothetical protein